MTQVYEIKKSRKWEKVRATSMKAISSFCKENGFKDWRMVGMMSRGEMVESKNLEVVAQSTIYFMVGKTKVKFISSPNECLFKKGDLGYIDGYVNGAEGRPYAVVVCGSKIDLTPTTALVVVNE